ncbi:MAG: hypothetical protein OXD38_10460 [Aestuariivita sp.]|nr:hypothetical protein [Aestuariivita sp.]
MSRISGLDRLRIARLDFNFLERVSSLRVQKEGYIKTKIGETDSVLV